MGWTGNFRPVKTTGSGATTDESGPSTEVSPGLLPQRARPTAPSVGVMSSPMGGESYDLPQRFPGRSQRISEHCGRGRPRVESTIFGFESRWADVRGRIQERTLSRRAAALELGVGVATVQRLLRRGCDGPSPLSGRHSHL